MAKKLAMVFGVILVIIGVLGFISNPLIGSMGLFQTDTVHNLVNLVIGVILVIVAYSAPASSALWLKIFGVIYLLLAILGFLMVPSGGMFLGFIAMNAADHWLHLVFGIVLVVAGMMKGGSSPSAPMPMQTM